MGTRGHDALPHSGRNFCRDPIPARAPSLVFYVFSYRNRLLDVEPTGPSVYRTVDREHPTLIIDEADDLFYRKSDLRAIVNAGGVVARGLPGRGVGTIRSARKFSASWARLNYPAR